ncbi:MAG: amidohydrolase [Oscillospiraceae bacterium]|nr:amidohydrolase [Oscillospiraceae bacterium]
MLLTNALVMPMDAPDIPCGYVRVAGGKIHSLGDMSVAPVPEPGEEVIGLAGKRLLPGFVEPHSHVGLEEDSLTHEGNDINEMTDPCTPHLRALDGINPMDRCFGEFLEAGITTAIVGPGSANPIAGQICAMKTYGKWIDAMAIRPSLAMKMAFGENPKNVYTEKNQQPNTRMATAAIIREHLTKAKRYMEGLDKAANDEEADRPDFDAKLDALVPLLRGEIHAHIHAHRAYDILTGIRIAKEFGIRYTLIHCTEGHLIADILARENAYAVCGPIISARVKPELSALTVENCRILREAGVNVAICTDHAVIPGQYLAMSARVAVSGGMAYRDALEAITIAAAKAAEVEDRVGSITPGKDADLLVFAGDPLDGIEKPEMVFVDGERVIGSR